MAYNTVGNSNADANGEFPRVEIVGKVAAEMSC